MQGLENRPTENWLNQQMHYDLWRTMRMRKLTA